MKMVHNSELLQDEQFKETDSSIILHHVPESIFVSSRLLITP